MDRKKIIALYDQDQRRAVRYPDSRREVAPGIVRHVSTAKAGEGVVIYSRLDGTNVDTTIDEQVAYFERLGQDFDLALSRSRTLVPANGRSPSRARGPGPFGKLG